LLKDIFSIQNSPCVAEADGNSQVVPVPAAIERAVVWSCFKV
jgi:hypothetical protein